MVNLSWYIWVKPRNSDLNLFLFAASQPHVSHFLLSHFLTQELLWRFSLLVALCDEKKNIVSHYKTAKYLVLSKTNKLELSWLIYLLCFDWSLWIWYTLRRSIYWLIFWGVVYHYQGVTGLFLQMVKIQRTTERRKEIFLGMRELQWETVLLNWLHYFRAVCQLFAWWQL